ncbi:MAG: YCF48-related protein, partial [Steroidobacteraceae bacterium]|nr:YCF48-related protein [Steroidobacteraceae bacterium]
MTAGVNRNSLTLAAALCAVLPGAAQTPLASLPSASGDGPARIEPLAVRSLLLDVAWAGERIVAVGERGHVLLSDDRGKTWVQSPEVPSRTMLTGVTFANRDDGWAVGHDEIILRTENGGQSWIAAHYAPERQQPLLDV